jgi:hypothetical protein
MGKLGPTGTREKLDPHPILEAVLLSRLYAV